MRSIYSDNGSNNRKESDGRIAIVAASRRAPEEPLSASNTFMGRERKREEERARRWCSAARVEGSEGSALEERTGWLVGWPACCTA